MEHHIPDVFRHSLVKYHQAEQDKGRLPSKWKQIWDKLETGLGGEESLMREEPSITTQQVRALGRSLHKKSTMDILVRGKLVRSADVGNIYNSAHRFEKHTYTTLTHCDTCTAILLGKVSQLCEYGDEFLQTFFANLF